VATATLGAVVAYGGLGRYIIDGIARNENDRLLAGVVLVATLAIAVELAFALVQRKLVPRGLRMVAAAPGAPARDGGGAASSRKPDRAPAV
jgi:osmoprotectant transport system permease protein